LFIIEHKPVTSVIVINKHLQGNVSISTSFEHVNDPFLESLMFNWLQLTTNSIFLIASVLLWLIIYHKMPKILTSLSHSSWSSDDELLPSLPQFDQLSDNLASMKSDPLGPLSSYVQDYSPSNIKPEPASSTASPRTPSKRTSKHDGETADQYSERARNDAERAREKALARFQIDEKRPRTRQACDRCRVC
jgi:hypothetical protein